MIKPDMPIDEAKRLATLKSLDILDTKAEERFDRITRMAKRMFHVPIALIRLLSLQPVASAASPLNAMVKTKITLHEILHVRTHCTMSSF